MISLTTIKKNIKEKIEVCVEQADRNITHSKTRLGEKRAYINFFVEENKSEGLITSELSDEGIYNRLKPIFKYTRDNEEDYYFVLFEVSLNHSRRHHDGNVEDGDDHELLHSLFLLMKEFWDEKAKLDTKKGVIYFIKGKSSDVQSNLMIDKLQDDNDFSAEQVNLYQEIFAENTRLAMMGNKVTFVDGTFTETFTEYTSEFLMHKRILRKVFYNFPELFNVELVYLDKPLNKLITNKPIKINYNGEKFDISLDTKDFKRLYLTPDLESLDIFECDITMESFREILEDVKEELKLIHLIDPPKETFKRLLLCLCLEDQMFIEEAYTKFQGYFNNWTAIENVSAQLIDNFETGKYTKVVYFVSEHRGHIKKYKRELVIQTFEIDSLYFHFIYNTDGDYSPSIGRDIIISTEEKPKELNEFVIKELLL